MSRRLCAHADQDGKGMHWIEDGQRCERDGMQRIEGEGSTLQAEPSGGGAAMTGDGTTLAGWYQFILDTRGNPPVNRQAIADLAGLINKGEFDERCGAVRYGRVREGSEQERREA